MNDSHDKADDVWRALAHSTRRRILDLLFVAPRTTGQLVSGLAMDRHLVIAHLSVLRDADLVTTQKQGRHRLNFLNPVPLQEIHQRWVARADGPWAAALIAVRDRAEASHATVLASDKATQDRTSHG